MYSLYIMTTGELPKLLIYGLLLICFFCIIPCYAQTAAELSDRGYALYKAGRWDEALNLYDQALSTDPNNVTILQNKMTVLHDLGRWDEGKDTSSLIDKNLENSTDPNYYYYWFSGGSALCGGYIYDGGNALMYRQDYQNALFYFNKVHETCPNDTDNVAIYGMEGYALSQLGRYNESLAAYDTAIRISNEKINEYANNEPYLKNKKHVEIDRQKVLNKMNGVKGLTTTPNTITPSGTASLVNDANLSPSRVENQGFIPPKETKKAPISPFIIVFSMCIAGSLLVITRKK
jgi:tetratricopeptide (TPR) repeat protein